MKIALVAHNLRVAGGLSVGKNILKTMLEIAPMHDYLMVVPEGCGYSDFGGHRNVSILKCPKMSLPQRWLWERRALSRAISRFDTDWIWALGNFAVRCSPCRQSLLFHNPHRVYRLHGGPGMSLRTRMWKWLSDREFRNGLHCVDRLYCQTETMRKRSHQVFGYPLERIGICPNAFSPSIQRGERWPAAIEHLRGRFVLLSLTRYYPHKNLEVIVETFIRYRSLLTDVACVLPVDKGQGRGAVTLIEQIRTEGLEQQIACVGAIPQERLGDFFFATDVMILPTLLESFSGTYLEAMHLDTPILTSDRDFAREVCGDAALYVDPLLVGDVNDGIGRLKSDHNLREELVAKGQNRLQAHLRAWPEILGDVLDLEGIEHEQPVMQRERR